MDYIVCGGIAYAIRGGVQLADCLVYSDTDFKYGSVAPSIIAQLRDASDKRTLYMNTVLGKTIDKNGAILPSDDSGRVEPKYSVKAGTAVEAQEVAPSVAASIIETAGKVAAYLEWLKIFQKSLSMPDLTKASIDTLDGKIASTWSTLLSVGTFTASLTQGPSGGISVTATGIPVPGSCSYTYHARWGFGTLQLKLVN